MEYITHSVEETENLASKLAKKLKGTEVIAFFGGLGMGKTAFTRGLCKGLNYFDGVQSPTFSLVNQYNADYTVYHFDMYRINTYDDLYSTGFFDYLDTGILVIEWSENIPELAAYLTNRCGVNIVKTGDNSRIIEYIPQEELC